MIKRIMTPDQNPVDWILLAAIKDRVVQSVVVQLG